MKALFSGDLEKQVQERIQGDSSDIKLHFYATGFNTGKTTICVPCFIWFWIICQCGGSIDRRQWWNLESYANLRCASLCRKLHWHVSMFFALFFCLSFEALGWSFVSFAAVRATPPVLSMWHWIIYNWIEKGQNMPVWLSKMALAQHFCTVCELCQLCIRRESNSMGAQYVTLQSINGWRKAQICRFGSAKWLWPSIFAQFVSSVSFASGGRATPRVLSMWPCKL